jgi:hypothetical protein
MNRLATIVKLVRRRHRAERRQLKQLGTKLPKMATKLPPKPSDIRRALGHRARLQRLLSG